MEGNTRDLEGGVTQSDFASSTLCKKTTTENYSLGLIMLLFTFVDSKEISHVTR